jgi:predicted extracellular nuclease
MRDRPVSRPRSSPALKSLLLLTGILIAPAVPAWGQATTLFFSEYVEGSSNNKALEIFNCTGADVNLAADGYEIRMYFNGNPVAGLTIPLTGTVANGDVYVVAHEQAVGTILETADQTAGGGFFNGNDAVALAKGTTVVDVVGQLGFDPGAQWGTGNTSTQDNTLRRRRHVSDGDTDGTNAFEPSIEWAGFPPDTFSGLGAHSALCGDLAAVIDALQNHTHTYRTGRGTGHNDVDATTGPATVSE